jgi:hypothetical protein
VRATAVALVAAALGVGLLAGCGGDDAPQSVGTCTNVRGGPDDPVSIWACGNDSDVTVLIDEYGFTGCRLVEGMDAEVDPSDSAYECVNEEEEDR